MVLVWDCESVIYISFPDLRFVSRFFYRLFLKFFNVDVSYNCRKRASHSSSVLACYSWIHLLYWKYVNLKTKFKRSAFCVGVKFVRVARSASFSSFPDVSWAAPSISTFVNYNSMSKDTMTSLSCTFSWLMVDMKCLELITD